MTIMVRIAIAAVLLLAFAGVVLYGSGFMGESRFIRNYELDEYAASRPFIKPAAIQNGLAIYAVGEGEAFLN